MLTLHPVGGAMVLKSLGTLLEEGRRGSMPQARTLFHKIRRPKPGKKSSEEAVAEVPNLSVYHLTPGEILWSRKLRTTQRKIVMAGEDNKKLANKPKIFEALKKKTHFSRQEIESLCKIYRSLIKSSGNTVSKSPATGIGTAPGVAASTTKVEGLDRVVFRELVHNAFDLVTEEILIDRIFCAFDKNNDGVIKLENWICGLSTFLRGTLEERAAFCFLVYDMNADGFLTRDEMMHLLRNSLMKSPQDEDPEEGVRDLVDLVTRKMDVDKDGKISYQDFLEAAKPDPISHARGGWGAGDIAKPYTDFTTEMDSANGSNRNKSTAAKVYDVLYVTGEIILFFTRIILMTLHGFYLLVFPPEEKKVAGEIVLITGTGHGIGKELAKQYGELGAEVVCVDVNSETNEMTVKELKKIGIRAHAYTCDVRSREAVLEISKKVLKEVGDVTILVNNAGIMPCKKFLAHTPEDIKRIFDVNVFSHFWTLEAFLPTMMKNNKGHIVCISSIAGLIGSPHVVPYSASKYAVRGLMEGLEEEFRTQCKNDNVHFTTIYPFMTDTGLCQKPNIKFTNFMKMLTPAQTAQQIIRAQRRGYIEASVPPYQLYTNNIVRTLPWGCIKLVIDFLGAKLDETE